LSGITDNSLSPANRTEVEGVRIAHAVQFLLRHAATHPAGAMPQQHLALLHTLRQGGFNFVQRNINGAGQMAGVEFGGRAASINGAPFSVAQPRRGPKFGRRLSL
jgi:hypothetical protein